MTALSSGCNCKKSRTPGYDISVAVWIENMSADDENNPFFASLYRLLLNSETGFSSRRYKQAMNGPFSSSPLIFQIYDISHSTCNDRYILEYMFGNETISKTSTSRMLSLQPKDYDFLVSIYVGTIMILLILNIQLIM